MTGRESHRDRLRRARAEVAAYRGDTRRVVVDITSLTHAEVGGILAGNALRQAALLARYAVALLLALSPFNGFNLCVYRRLGMKIGKNVYIAPLGYLDVTRPDLIRIGDDVMIGMGTAIAVHERNMESLALGRVVVEDGVTVGARCLIRHGVTLGRGSTVEAMSCLRHDVRPGERSFGGRKGGGADDDGDD